MTDDIDEKTGDSVADVLRRRHQMFRSALPHLSKHRDTDVDVTRYAVEHAAGRLTGSAGLVGADAHARCLTGFSVLES
jgi:hypothetical protein